MASLVLGAAETVVSGLGQVSGLLPARPHYEKLVTGPYAAPESPEPGAAWVNSYKHGSTVPFPGCDTLFSCFQYSCGKNPTKPAAGTRELIRTEKDGNYEKLVLGDYKWLTYAEMSTRVDHFATGLVGFTGLMAGSKVVIYGETSANWMVAAQAVWRQNGTVVTVYATLGEEGVNHGLRQTEAPVVIADAKLFHFILACAPSCPTATHLVVFGTLSASQMLSLTTVRPDIKVSTFEALVAAGSSAPSVVAPSPPSPKDVAVIMYTSGTTGPPKGVMLPHSSIMAAAAGLVDAGRFTSAEVYMAYLPLAHIMEVAAEAVIFAFGGAVGYGTPQTLTDTGLKLAKGTSGDAVVLKPTFMVFAPLVLDRVRQAVQAKIAAASPLKQALFGHALAAGYYEFDRGKIGAPPLWNALVFKKIQMAIGGRVTGIVTGSAPLSADTQKFIQVCFNCPVRQGYGLTETCAAATVGAYDSNVYSAGVPLSSCKIKLVDWEEGGYRARDAADPAIGVPRGEVLVGGPCVCAGYYNNPNHPDEDIVAKNSSEFHTDASGCRWFHTGDIGEITPEGFLRIIDRKKDLVKLQQGEYVALSQVENAMKHSPYVDNALCHALSSKSNTVALVVPAAKPLRAWAEKAGAATADTPMEALCALPAAEAEVLRSIQAACKGKVAQFSIPHAVALVADPWSPENDLLTAAMKLKRAPIVKAYAKDLDRIYK